MVCLGVIDVVVNCNGVTWRLANVVANCDGLSRRVAEVVANCDCSTGSD